MIKFFRHIRKRLLSENKFSNYLLYAIGEIILVVVGILIAIQINNSNEIKKTRNKEITILNQMHSNLQADLKDLEFNVKHNKERIFYNEGILNVMDEKLAYNDTLKPYFGKIFGNFQLSENTSAWENLKSVGMDLISNDTLRENISNLYSNKYQYLENLEKRLDDKYHWDYFYPKVLEHISFDKFGVSGRPQNYNQWVNDIEFYEVIKMNLEFRTLMQYQYEQNYASIKRLILQIDNHLKSLQQ